MTTNDKAPLYAVLFFLLSHPSSWLQITELLPNSWACWKFFCHGRRPSSTL